MTIINEDSNSFVIQKWQIGKEGNKYFLLTKGQIKRVSYDKQEIEKEFKEKIS